jgi:hypothetical protein
MTSQNPYDSPSLLPERRPPHPLTAICDVIAIAFAGMPLLVLGVLVVVVGNSDDMSTRENNLIILFILTCLALFVFYVISAIYNLVGTIMRRPMAMVGLTLNVLTFSAWFLENLLNK